MVSSARSIRSTAIACAAQWLVVGLTLAELLNGVDNASIRHVKIIMLIGFLIGGVFSIVQLWTAAPGAGRSDHGAAT